MAKKWQLCIFLFLATTLNYLNRQTVSILAPLMQKEMHLDNQALGSIFSAFYYAYTFSQFAGGMILDRVNLRWALAIAVLGWSLVTAFTGLAAGFGALWTARLALGVVESTHWPASTRIVARVLGPRERALGNGIFTSGTSIAALIAPALILAISSAFGWRWTFAVIGLMGLAWPVGWCMFTRRPEWEGVWRDPAATSKSGTSVTSGLLTVLKSPRFLPVFLVAVVINPCLYFSVNWLPTYFAQQRGLTPGRQVGWILTAIYLGLDLGTLACGTIILLLTRRGYSVQTAWRIVLFVASVSTACCALVPLLLNLPLAVLALAAVNFGLGIWTAMMLTMIQEVSPTHVSTSQGVFGATGSLAGAWAMSAVGKITQATSSFSIPFVTVALAAMVAGVASWFASRNAGVKQELSRGR